VRSSGLLVLDYHEAGGVVAFVGHTDMGLEAAGREPVGKLSAQSNLGFSARRLDNLTVAPGHRHAHAEPDRFRERFLGREASREIAQSALFDLRAPQAKDLDLVR